MGSGSMIFVIMLAIKRGPMAISCSDADELRANLRERMSETADTVLAAGKWADDARPGDWIDLPRCWVFAASGPPTKYETQGGSN